MQAHTLSDADWTEIQATLRELVSEFRENNELVKETDEYLVFADGHGHELNEIASAADVDRDALSTRMHEEAGDRTDYNWGYADPVVIEKH